MIEQKLGKLGEGMSLALRPQPVISQRPAVAPSIAIHRLEFRAHSSVVVNAEGVMCAGNCVVESSDVIGQALLDAHDKARKEIGACRLVAVTPSIPKYRLEFRSDIRRFFDATGDLVKAVCVVEAADCVGQSLLAAHEAARKQIGPCRLAKVVKAGEA